MAKTVRVELTDGRETTALLLTPTRVSANVNWGAQRGPHGAEWRCVHWDPAQSLRQVVADLLGVSEGDVVRCVCAGVD